jgi:HAD superfamily hydrolase (TIGR01509 family)
MGLNVTDALLVDLDGTLVDTGEANFQAYAAALREAGVEIGRRRFDELSQGRNWRNFLPLMLAGAEASPEAVAARKAALYGDFLHLTVLNSGVARLLELCRAQWRCALVTTASRRNAEAILHYHNIEHLFDCIVTGDDVARHKPDPEAYRLAAEWLGAEPQRCVAIEDTDIGAASASAFGAAVIRVQPLKARAG